MAGRDYTSPISFELPIEEEIRRAKRGYERTPEETDSSFNSKQPTTKDRDRRIAPREALIIKGNKN